MPDTDILTTGAVLKKLRTEFPVFADFKPLKLGIHKDLIGQGVAPEKRIRPALARQTMDERYLRNIAAGGSRYAIDGTPAGQITPLEQEAARQRLADIKNGRPGPLPIAASKKPLQELIMHANTVRITAVVTDFERHLNVDTIGAASVPITVEIAAGKLKANLNPKSFRKAQATYKEADGQVAVVISGEFDMATGTIKSAGILVQPKKPKQSAAD